MNEIPKFESNPEYVAALDRLKAEFAAPKRGVLVPWQTIQETIGRHRDDKGGWTVIGRFRKWLRKEHRIVTFPEPTVGLRFLTHKEAATEVPEHRQRRAFRQIARGIRETATVDPNQLTEAGRRVFFAQRRNLSEQRRTIQRSRRYLEATVTPTQTNPLRKNR